MLRGAAPLQETNETVLARSISAGDYGEPLLLDPTKDDNVVETAGSESVVLKRYRWWQRAHLLHG
jgi:hypothetical protein